MKFPAPVLSLVLLSGGGLIAQAPAAAPDARAEEIQQLRAELARISARLDTLEHEGAKTAATPAMTELSSPPVSPPAKTSAAATSAAGPGSAGPPPPSAATSTAAQAPAAATGLGAILPVNLPGGATLNYTFDGYYGFNFNRPPGRVNELRAYDVLSNAFSINQASLMYELAPDAERRRPLGLRLDLQFGQATGTLQGNGANEQRPDIYRNIFQAYGTYVVPVGSGLTLDFGKWASSLGIEGNYSKDQSNYSRSFYFYFLPFYHEGLRASYQVNSKLKLNYWLVNGTNQTEPTNGFKDELFGFALSPSKKLTWTSNYYLGQEHADATPGTDCTTPVQPGLCLDPISPAPNGKLHIIDNYVTWQATPKLTLTGEGDYVIQRLWKQAGPGQSAAPQHLDGGAAYGQYQLTPRNSLAVRGEYMSDRNGLFSNRTQALKEATATWKFTLADGLDVFTEFRRDWSNDPYFRTHDPNILADHQTTATMGLVWWYGGKQGNW